MTADDTGDEEPQSKSCVKQHDKDVLLLEDNATKRECKLVRDLVAVGVVERNQVLSFDWSPKCLFGNSDVSQKIVGLEDKIGDKDTIGNRKLAAAVPDDESDDAGSSEGNIDEASEALFNALWDMAVEKSLDKTGFAKQYSQFIRSRMADGYSQAEAKTEAKNTLFEFSAGLKGVPRD